MDQDPMSPSAIITIGPERVTDTQLDLFQSPLVTVQSLSPREIQFDLVGVDASIANALRRILIAEVPTICIEEVYIYNNSSVVHDEILAHRIGLVPLNVDPSLMRPRVGEPTDRDTIVFKLSLACSARKKPYPDGLDPRDLYENHELLSSHLRWDPEGLQPAMFAHRPPAPTNPNIVLAKLRPGQKVALECRTIKGVGKDHAKFSPVATAAYRLLPTIILNPEHPVPPHLADKFASCFPKGIISVDPITKTVSVNEREVRRDPVTREVLRHPEFEACVKLGRIKDHFLFKIESEGPYEPQDLLIEAIKVMREKIKTVREAAKALLKDDLDIEMTES